MFIYIFYLKNMHTDLNLEFIQDFIQMYIYTNLHLCINSFILFIILWTLVKLINKINYLLEDVCSVLELLHNNEK